MLLKDNVVVEDLVVPVLKVYNVLVRYKKLVAREHVGSQVIHYIFIILARLIVWTRRDSALLFPKLYNFRLGINCPNGVPVVRCVIDPCQLKTCSDQKATCVSNYCGGCNAVFYNYDGQSKAKCLRK